MRPATRQRSLIRRCIWLAGLVAAGATASACAAAPADERLEQCTSAISAQLDERVSQTLSRIDGAGRQLLALRSYLRSGNRLAERWSWTEEQIAAYVGSPEQRDLQAEIEHVRAAFAAANPGFDLWVNPQVRSLDIQLARWNENASVAAAAEDMLSAARQFVASDTFPAAQPARAREACKAFLSAHVPVPTPALAAPGLSPHGQMRAIDFQVQQDDRIVAGPDTATIADSWDAQGWAAKLDAAVREASRKFVGPLASPREPWHFTYSPEAVASQ